MKSKTAKYTAALASMALAASSHAATIVWTGSTFFTDNTSPFNMATGQFATTGTQILAENSGGGSVTFDGITFAAPTIGFDASFGDYHQGTPVTLASTGTYMNATVAGTVSLTGLTSGYTYRIQALVYDGRSLYAGKTVEFDSTNLGVYSNGVLNVKWGDGLLATGTFVADAASQNFTIQTFNVDTTASGGQLNAITLYQTAIPEPSAALLGGLGMLALLRRRR